MAQIAVGLLAGGIGAYGFMTDWTFKQGITGSSSSSGINYDQLREDIEEIIPKPGYDDGSIGPVLVRLAWHSSGTYDAKSNTGGSNGSTMRFKPEMSDGANAGLNKAQEFLEPIKKKYPGLSYADLWILSSYVALEFMGAPRIPFTPGRTDAKDDSKCPPNGRLPDASQGASHIRNVFQRMGFTDREMVVLIGGGHAIGRCHKDRSGFDGPWTNSPIGMSNQFFKELFNNTWNERKWDGPRQFEDKSKKLMMLPTDMEIKNDKQFRKWAELYKEDQEQFLSDFADTFKKLTELGFSPNK